MKRLLMAVVYFLSLFLTPTAQLWAEESFEKNLHRKISEEAKQAEEKQDDTYWVAKGAAMVGKECSVQGLDCVLEILESAKKEANGDVLQAVVCLANGEDCVAALAYGQGAVHYALENLMYHQNRPVFETGPQFVELVSEYGLHSEWDRQLAMKYLYSYLKQTRSDCKSRVTDSITVGSVARMTAKQRRIKQRQGACASGIAAMPVLAMLAKTREEKNQVADTVYDFLKRRYKTPSGSAVMMVSVVAFGVLGSSRAYEHLEKFLTENSVKRPDTGVGRIMAEPGKFAAETGIQIANSGHGGADRYLNQVNEAFQYADEQEAKQLGTDNTNEPTRNFMEDIGNVLADQSTENMFALALAKKLVSQTEQYIKSFDNLGNVAAQNQAGGNPMYADSMRAMELRSFEIEQAKIHFPLVLGILDGWAQRKKYASIPSERLLSFFYQGDWWDINEATQRSIHYKAYQFANMRGLGFAAPVRDEAKMKRYAQNQAALAVAKKVDTVYNTAMFVSLALALPTLIKGIPQAVRLLSKRSGLVRTKNFISKLPRKAKKMKPAKGTAAAAADAQGATKGVKLASKAKVKTQVSGGKAAPRNPAGSAGAPEKTLVTKERTEQVNAFQKQLAQQPVAAPDAGAVPVEKIDQAITGPLEQKVAQAGKRPYVKPEMRNSEFGLDKAVASSESERLAAAGKSKGGLFDKLFGGRTDEWGQTKEVQKILKDPDRLISYEPVFPPGKGAPAYYDIYSLDEKGQVVRGQLSNAKATKLIESLPTDSQSDRARALRKIKYDKEVKALKSVSDKPSIKVVNREKPGIEIINREKPGAKSIAKNATGEEMPVKEALSDNVAAARKAEQTRRAEEARKVAEARKAGEADVLYRGTGPQAAVTNQTAQKISELGNQAKTGKSWFTEISENLKQIHSSDAPLTPAQRARVEEAERYFSRLTQAQADDWAVITSPEFQKYSAVLRSPTATGQAFYVEGADLDMHFKNAPFMQKTKGFVPTIVGNPEKGFVRADLQKAFKTAERTNEPVLVQISSHGDIDSAGKFYLSSRGLYSSAKVKTADLVEDLQQLRKVTGTPEINLQLDACHSGQFLQEFEALPEVQRAGINVYAHAGASQQCNFVEGLAAAARSRGTGSIASYQTELLLKHIDRGNVFARGYVNGASFNPLEQAVWRAKREGSPLAEQLEVLHNMQSANRGEISAVMAKYKQFNARSGFFRGSDFTTGRGMGSVRVSWEVNSYISDTAKKMLSGQRWKKPGSRLISPTRAVNGNNAKKGLIVI